MYGLRLALQQAQDRQDRQSSTLSNITKTIHDTEKDVINNIK